MRILKASIAVTAMLIPAVGIAHTPVWVPYDTRGECETQMAADNIFHSRDKVTVSGAYGSVGEAMSDKDRVALYDTVGDAQQAMHDHFWCEQSDSDGLWYMLRTPF